MTLIPPKSIGDAVCGDEILQLEPVVRIWIILTRRGLLLVSSAWSVGGPEGEGRWQDPGRANACGLRIKSSFFFVCVVDRGYIAQRMNDGCALSRSSGVYALAPRPARLTTY